MFPQVYNIHIYIYTPALLLAVYGTPFLYQKGHPACRRRLWGNGISQSCLWLSSCNASDVASCNGITGFPGRQMALSMGTCTKHWRSILGAAKDKGTKMDVQSGHTGFIFNRPETLIYEFFPGVPLGHRAHKKVTLLGISIVPETLIKFYSLCSGSWSVSCT